MVKVRLFYLFILFLIIPIRLPAPDLPGTPDSFALLDGIRAEAVKRDKASYIKHYHDFKKFMRLCGFARFFSF